MAKLTNERKPYVYPADDRLYLDMMSDMSYKLLFELEEKLHDNNVFVMSNKIDSGVEYVYACQLNEEDALFHEVYVYTKRNYDMHAVASFTVTVEDLLNHDAAAVETSYTGYTRLIRANPNVYRFCLPQYVVGYDEGTKKLIRTKRVIVKSVDVDNLSTYLIPIEDIHLFTITPELPTPHVTP